MGDNIGDQELDGIVEYSNLIAILNPCEFLPRNLLRISGHFLAVLEEQMQLAESNKSLKIKGF